MSDSLRRAVESARVMRNGHKIMSPHEQRIDRLEKDILSLITRVVDLENEVEELKSRRRRDEVAKAPLSLTICLVSSRTRISVEDIKSQRRNASTVLARHVFMYMARYHTRFSLAEIGRFLDGMDHTSVMHGVERIENQRKFDLGLDAMLTEMAGYLNEGRESPEELARDVGIEPTSAGLEAAALPLS